MTEAERKLLDDLDVKVRHLMYLHDKLKRENTELKQLLQEKDNEIRKAKDDWMVMRDNYTNLKQARIISVNDNEVRDTKQRLSKLVREVDKCIALLNQ